MTGQQAARQQAPGQGEPGQRRIFTKQLRLEARLLHAKAYRRRPRDEQESKWLPFAVIMANSSKTMSSNKRRKASVEEVDDDDNDDDEEGQGKVYFI